MPRDFHFRTALPDGKLEIECSACGDILSVVPGVSFEHDHNPDGLAARQKGL